MRAKFLRVLARAGKTANWLTIAELVVDHLFSGKAEDYLAGWAHNERYGRLLSRTGWICPHERVFEAVRILAQVPGYGRHVVEGLSLTVHKVLLTVAGADERASLAVRAHAERWTRRALEKEIRQLRALGHALGRPRGRPRHQG